MAIGKVRRSQLVTTYGVGGIVPVEDSAFMVMGLESWGHQTPDLHDARLERRLGVSGFVQPPVSEYGRDIPVTRFPVYQSCPICRRLGPHESFTSRDLNTCTNCGQALIPSRFVVACENGHIDDFPYGRWVHQGRPCGGELGIRTVGNTGSLAGIAVTCSCGAERTMEDAFDRFALRDVTKCTGRHPWLAHAREDCKATPRTLQRGSSSVWFGETRSALSIPPWSQAASRAMDAHWATLRVIPQAVVGEVMRGLRLDERTGYSIDELVEVHAARLREEDPSTPLAGGIRSEEYRALVRGNPASGRDVDFETRPGGVSSRLAPYLAQVELVTRLREIRALVGFSRVVPPHSAASEASNVVSIRADGVPWLPAIEVKGEGLFVRLNPDALAVWSSGHTPGVLDRVEVLRGRDLARHQQRGTVPEYEVTAEFLLLHVFAHALISQLALDAGYPAASLRERIYSGPDMAGVLVYTATTDSGGSLGGLVAQGEKGEFERLVHDAIAAYRWCSSDPVCIETSAAGADSLNLAACHTCALLPETSCEERNLFLDRGLLVGWPDFPDSGFFSGLV